MHLLTLIVLALFSGKLLANSQGQSFDVKTPYPKKLIIENRAGEIEVERAHHSKFEVRYKKVDFVEGCELKFEQTAEALKIRVVVSSPEIKAKCNVHYDILAPEQLSVEINNGAGDLELESLVGEINYNLGMGNVEIKNHSGNVNGKTGKGDVSLHISSLDNLKQIDLTSGKGDVVLKLPPQTNLKSELKTGLGKVKNDFSDEVSAQLQVKVQTGLGEIRLLKN